SPLLDAGNDRIVPRLAIVVVKWRSRPLPKFMVGPNAINGRQRRLNKAAGAADAGSQCSAATTRGDRVRVTRRSCDPLTQNDAGGTPASQLLSEDHKSVPPYSMGVR